MDSPYEGWLCGQVEGQQSDREKSEVPDGQRETQLHVPFV